MINFADIPKEELEKIPSYCAQVMQGLIQNMELEGKLDGNTCNLLGKSTILIVAMNLTMSHEEIAQIDRAGDEVLKQSVFLYEGIHEIFEKAAFTDEYWEDLCASGHTV